MEFTYPLFVDLFTYWKSRCTDDGIPTIENFDMLDLPTVLPDITYWEMEPEGRIICRMTGTKVVERMNTDITGMYLDSLMLPETQTIAHQAFQVMQSHPCGLWLRSTNHHPSGRIVRMEALTLPLSPTGSALPKFVTANHQIETIGYDDTEEGHKLILGQPLEQLEYVDVGWGAPEKPQ